MGSSSSSRSPEAKPKTPEFQDSNEKDEISKTLDTPLANMESYGSRVPAWASARSIGFPASDALFAQQGRDFRPAEVHRRVFGEALEIRAEWRVEPVKRLVELHGNSISER